MAKKDAKVTVVDFLKVYSGAPYDREEVARVAARTDGPLLGPAARAWLAADEMLTAVLQDVGYEEG